VEAPPRQVSACEPSAFLPAVVAAWNTSQGEPDVFVQQEEKQKMWWQVLNN
jgi:hypothetical protein